MDLTPEEKTSIERLARASGSSVAVIEALVRDLKSEPANPHAVAAQLRALGITPKMLAETKPTHTAPEMHGTIVQPRMKWTCGACRKRNDSRLQVPLARIERVACKSCHRVTRFTVSDAPPAASPPIDAPVQ